MTQAKLSLVLVQNRPTQFDQPLYEKLAACADVELLIVYTQAESDGSPAVDAETGAAPVWDHADSASYPKLYLGTDPIPDYRRLLQEISRFEPDFVLLCGYSPPVHARLAWSLKRKGIRIGLRSDNTLEHSDFSGIKGFAKRVVLPRLLSMYDTWHPVGTLAREYLESVSRRQRPVFLFPYGIDVDWFREHAAPVRESRGDFRRELGIEHDRIVILGVMKWHDREDPLTLIRACARLQDKGDRIHLLLLGDGPLRNAVTHEARSLEGQCSFPGLVSYSQLPRFYALSDIFVHTAPDEPWGVSVQEAMACGLPVLASFGVGAARDFVTSGVEGDVFPISDDQELARQLSKVITSPGMLRQMGARAAHRAGQWNYDFVINQMRTAACTKD